MKQMHKLSRDDEAEINIYFLYNKKGQILGNYFILERKLLFSSVFSLESVVRILF